MQQALLITSTSRPRIIWSVSISSRKEGVIMKKIVLILLIFASASIVHASSNSRYEYPVSKGSDAKYYPLNKGVRYIEDGVLYSKTYCDGWMKPIRFGRDGEDCSIDSIDNWTCRDEIDKGTIFHRVQIFSFNHGNETCRDYYLMPSAPDKAYSSRCISDTKYVTGKVYYTLEANSRGITNKVAVEAYVRVNCLKDGDYNFCMEGYR